MKNKKIPMRKCVGCMESKPKNSMLRIAYYEGDISVDFTGKAKGRGVYICPDASCIEKAKKRNALRRSFDADIPKERMDEVFEELTKHEKKGD